MAILNLEEIDGSLDLDVVESTDTPELPLEEIQEVQEETQALEDATELLEDMEEAAQQQAVTINNIEGDASEINSAEEGEELSSVEPEFTQDDIENNPEMVQDIVSEQQAAMEAFAVKITGKTGKSMRNQLFGYFGINPVSHESIRVNPFEAYKVTHEGLKETIKEVIKKIKYWILGLGQKLKALYSKFRVWMSKTKESDKKEIDKAKKNVSSFPSERIEENIFRSVITACETKYISESLQNINVAVEVISGEKGVKFPSKLKTVKPDSLTDKIAKFENKNNIYSITGGNSDVKVLTIKPGNDDVLIIKNFNIGKIEDSFTKQEIAHDLPNAVKQAEAMYKDFDRLVKLSMNITDLINKKIETFDKNSVKQSDEELKVTNKMLKNLSVIGTFNSVVFNGILKGYSSSIKVCKFINARSDDKKKK